MVGMPVKDNSCKLAHILKKLNSKKNCPILAINFIYNNDIQYTYVYNE